MVSGNLPEKDGKRDLLGLLWNVTDLPSRLLRRACGPLRWLTRGNMKWDAFQGRNGRVGVGTGRRLIIGGDKNISTDCFIMPEELTCVVTAIIIWMIESTNEFFLSVIQAFEYTEKKKQTGVWRKREIEGKAEWIWMSIQCIWPKGTNLLKWNTARTWVRHHWHWTRSALSNNVYV